MNVDLELYRVFCEVVKYKSISKAAENMYISQSAITQSIQKLENILGGKVFYRNKTGVELTEEGRNLYEYVKDSIETMSNAEKIFSKYVNLEKGKIRIGGNNSLISALIINPLLAFSKKYPNVEIEIVTGKTESLVQKLSNGEIDLVTLNLPFKNKNYANVEVFPIREVNYVFFASKEYVKKYPVKNIYDLVNHRLILPKEASSRRKILLDFCEKKNLVLNANFSVSNSIITKKLVLENVGIGFASEENLKDIQKDIVIIKEDNMCSALEGIATLKKNMSNKATIEFIKEIKEFYK